MTMDAYDPSTLPPEGHFVRHRDTGVVGKVTWVEGDRVRFHTQDRLQLHGTWSTLREDGWDYFGPSFTIHDTRACLCGCEQQTSSPTGYVHGHALSDSLTVGTADPLVSFAVTGPLEDRLKGRTEGWGEPREDAHATDRRRMQQALDILVVNYRVARTAEAKLAVADAMADTLERLKELR